MVIYFYNMPKELFLFVYYFGKLYFFRIVLLFLEQIYQKIAEIVQLIPINPVSFTNILC